jgi:hypothetical protein
MCDCDVCKAVGAIVHRALENTKTRRSGRTIAREENLEKRDVNHYLDRHREIYSQDSDRYWRLAVAKAPQPAKAVKERTKRAPAVPPLPYETLPAVRRARKLDIVLPGSSGDPASDLFDRLSLQEFPSRQLSRTEFLKSKQEQRNALLKEAARFDYTAGLRFAKDCSDILARQFKRDPTGIWIGNIVGLGTARMAAALYYASEESCARASLRIGQFPRTGTNADIEQLAGAEINNGITDLRLVVADDDPDLPNAPANSPRPKTIRAVGELELHTRDERPVIARDEEFVVEIGEANPPWLFDLINTGYGILRWPAKSDVVTFLYPITPAE